MAIIHAILTPDETRRLSQRDSTYLKSKLEANCLLNTILNKPINSRLLYELRCILDSKAIPRRKTERHERCSKVRVYDHYGKLVRILYANGRVMREV